MSYEAIIERAKVLPEYYIDEVCEFMDFLSSKVKTEKVEKVEKTAVRYATSIDTSWMDESWHSVGGGKPMTRDEIYGRI